MRYLLLLQLYLGCYSVLAQSNYVVEKVLLANTIDESKSAVPRLKDNSNPKNPVVAKVNALLLERFDLTSYDQNKVEEFRWSGTDFRYEAKDNILFITYSGEYYGAYPNAVEEELFFDLTHGSLLNNRDIPFQAWFSLKGYFDFMNKFWLPKVKPIFKESVTCAEMEPSCSFYDITRGDYGSNDFFTCSLVSDCYPHVVQACDPDYTLTIPGDSLKPYLSEFGKTNLIKEHYSQLGGVAKYQFNKKVESQIPNNIFLIGKINDKYEFSMAITLNKSTHRADGYYYYERRKIPITLSGSFDDASIQLEEFSNGKVTGRMLFTLRDEYVENAFSLYGYRKNGATYFSGVWTSPDDKTKMNIAISEIKSTQPSQFP